MRIEMIMSQTSNDQVRYKLLIFLAGSEQNKSVSAKEEDIEVSYLFYSFRMIVSNKLTQNRNQNIGISLLLSHHNWH